MNGFVEALILAGGLALLFAWVWWSRPQPAVWPEDILARQKVRRMLPLLLLFLALLLFGHFAL